MEISRSKLVEILGIVSLGLASKEMIEQTTCIAFLPGMLMTYNDELAVMYPVEEVDITGAVSSKELVTFCNKVKGETISLTVEEDTSEILLVSGKSKAGLTFIPEVKLPRLSYPEKFRKLPTDFVQGVRYTVGCAGSDFTKAILTNICISKEEVVGTDGQRLGKWQWASPLSIKEQMLLPSHQISKLVKLSLVGFAQADGWVHLKTKEGCICSLRIFEDQFPQYQFLLDYEKENVLSFPDTLPDLIERGEIFGKGLVNQDNSILVSFTKNKLTIEARNDAGWYKENVRVEYKGKDISFVISPSSLKNILSRTQEGYIHNQRIIFAKDNLTYVSVLKLQD